MSFVIIIGVEILLVFVIIASFLGSLYGMLFFFFRRVFFINDLYGRVEWLGLEFCVFVFLDVLMVRFFLYFYFLVLGDVLDLGLKVLEEKRGGGDGEEREEGFREN